MSVYWGAAGVGLNEDGEPVDAHRDDCNIWKTNRKPCNCHELRNPPLALPPVRRHTTAERLNQLVPCDRDPFDGAA